MRRVLLTLFLIGMLLPAAGCCTNECRESGPVCNAYYDAVDNVENHGIYFDDVYYSYCELTNCAQCSPFGNCY